MEISSISRKTKYYSTPKAKQKLYLYSKAFSSGTKQF